MQVLQNRNGVIIVLAAPPYTRLQPRPEGATTPTPVSSGIKLAPQERQGEPHLVPQSRSEVHEKGPFLTVEIHCHDFAQEISSWFVHCVLGRHAYPENVSGFPEGQ